MGEPDREKNRDFIQAIPVEGDFVRRYLEWASKMTDAPCEFLVAGALACMSVAVGRRVVLNNRIYANLWLVLMGDSSVFRKSTSIALARTLCEQAGLDVFPDRITPESFYETLAREPQGLFALSELGGWLGAMSRSYAAGLKQDMTELYDCPAEFRRIRKGPRNKIVEFKVRHPYIVLLSASTLEWFQQHVQEDDSAGGFLPRFQFVLGRGREPYPIPPRLEIPAELLEQLRRISETTGNILLDQSTKGPYEVYSAWFYQFREKLQEYPVELIPYAVRLETLALKLAVLFEADAKPGQYLEQLSPASIAKGCSYAEYFLESARKVIERLSFTSFERLCRKVEDVIAKMPGATQRDILRSVCVPKQNLDEALMYLQQSGRIHGHAVKPEGRGRPTIRYYPA
ncbi:MAG: hypothetical protein ACPLQP_07760 [Moorellaceae bacterium]